MQDVITPLPQKSQAKHVWNCLTAPAQQSRRKLPLTLPKPQFPPLSTDSSMAGEWVLGSLPGGHLHGQLCTSPQKPELMGCGREGETEDSPHQPGPRRPARGFLREAELNQAEQGQQEGQAEQGTGHSSRGKAGAEAWEGGRQLIPSSLAQNWTGRRAGTMTPERGHEQTSWRDSTGKCAPARPGLGRLPQLQAFQTFWPSSEESLDSLEGPWFLSFERDPSARPAVSGTSLGTFPTVIPFHLHAHSARQEDCAHLADWESEATAQGVGPFGPRLLLYDP